MNSRTVRSHQAWMKTLLAYISGAPPAWVIRAQARRVEVSLHPRIVVGKRAKILQLRPTKLARPVDTLAAEGVE